MKKGEKIFVELTQAEMVQALAQAAVRKVYVPEGKLSASVINRQSGATVEFEMIGEVEPGHPAIYS